MTAPSRRGFLTGLGAALVGLAAPAVIRTPGLLMPARAIPVAFTVNHVRRAQAMLTLNDGEYVMRGNLILTIEEFRREMAKMWMEVRFSPVAQQIAAYA